MFKYANDLWAFSLDYQSFNPPSGEGVNIHRYIDLFIKLLHVYIFKS
jgi:hypothetical protein